MLGGIHNLWQLGTNPEYSRIQTGNEYICASVGVLHYKSLPNKVTYANQHRLFYHALFRKKSSKSQHVYSVKL